MDPAVRRIVLGWWLGPEEKTLAPGFCKTIAARPGKFLKNPDWNHLRASSHTQTTNHTAPAKVAKTGAKPKAISA